MIKESFKSIALGDIKPLKNLKQESAVSFQVANSCQDCPVPKQCQEKKYGNVPFGLAIGK